MSQSAIDESDSSIRKVAQALQQPVFNSKIYNSIEAVRQSLEEHPEVMPATTPDLVV